MQPKKALLSITVTELGTVKDSLLFPAKKHKMQDLSKLYRVPSKKLKERLSLLRFIVLREMHL